SNTRLQTIIEDFGLYKEERKNTPEDQIITQMRDKDISLKLESGLPGGNAARPDAIRISYEAKDPKVAAAVANRLATLIIDENTGRWETDGEDSSEFLQEQLKQSKATLDKLESAVGSYKLSHSGELPEQELALSGTLSRLQTELQGTQDSLNRAEQSKIL